VRSSASQLLKYDPRMPFTSVREGPDLKGKRKVFEILEFKPGISRKKFKVKGQGERWKLMHRNYFLSAFQVNINFPSIYKNHNNLQYKSYILQI